MKFRMKIYVEKPDVNGSFKSVVFNINYEGKFTLIFLIKINVEKPDVN